MRTLVLITILVTVAALAGCGTGGGGGSSSTPAAPPNLTPMPVTLGTATFETNPNLSTFSRDFSNNNSDFFHHSTYSMAGFGSRVGLTLTISFADATIDGVTTIRMSEDFGGGTVETYDLACATNGAIYNLQAAGRTGDNFTTTGNATTPPIFIPATVSNGATWTGGFTQTGGMSIISVNDTGPASTIPGEIHIRQAAAPGNVQLEFYLKIGWGFTDVTANSNVDGYKTNLTGPG